MPGDAFHNAAGARETTRTNPRFRFKITLAL
jgi:hypothetical protein